MATFDEMVTQFVSPVLAKTSQVMTTLPEKKAQVDGNTAYKIAVARSMGVNSETNDPVQQDMMTLSDFDIYAKYGADAPSLIAARANATSSYALDNSGQRSNREAITDTALDITQGVASILGIGAWGLGAVAPGAGTSAAREIDAMNGWINSQKSNARQNREVASGVRSTVNQEANEALFKEEQARELKLTGDDTFSSLKRIGRDAFDAMGNYTEDRMILGGVSAQAVGSLVTTAPLSKALSLIGNTVSRGAASARLTQMGKAVSVPASIGLLEGGGAYQQTVSDAYETLRDRTDLTEEQKIQMANDAGLKAANLQALAGAATGTLVGRFEADPFAPVTIRGFVNNALKEAVEEGAQSGFGQYTQNQGIRDYVDPNRDPLQGVGEQVGAGIVGGIGAAGSVQSPQLAAHTAIETAKLPVKGTVAVAKATGKAIMNQFTKRGEAVIADIEQEASQYQQPEEVIPPIVQPSRFETMTNIASTIFEKGRSQIDRLMAAKQLNDLVDEERAVQASLVPAEGTEPVATPVEDNITPFQQTQEQAAELYSKRADRIRTADVSPENGQNIELAIGLAQTNPDKVNPDQNDQILFHADQGRINLTPAQRNTLRVSSALVRANIDYNEKRSAIQLPKANIVSREIQSEQNGPEEIKKSLKTHMQGVAQAYSAGDTELASQRLGELRLFAQHMSNKVLALNESLAKGKTDTKDGIRYNALVGNGRFRPSVRKLAVNPYVAGSVRFAQQVALDAEAVATVTNSLADIFPDLGIEHFQAVPLDASLQGPATEVESEYRAGRRKVPSDVVETNLDQQEVQGGNSQTEAEVPSENTVEEVSQESEPEGEQKPQNEEDIQDTMPQQQEELPVEQDNVPVENPQSPVEEIADKPSIEKVYPMLRGGQDNIVRKGFKLPVEPKTRTVGNESPYQTIKDALKSATSLRQFLGSDLNRSYSDVTAEAYADYLKLGSRMGKVMNDRLAAFLAKNAKGFKLHWREALATNITNEDGTYVAELQQLAVLAGLNWFLKLDSFASRIDAKIASEILGYEVNEGDVLIDRLNRGMGATELSRSLAQEIKKFWGLEINQSLSVNQTEGVIEAVAKEVIEAMIELKAFTLDEIEVGQADTKRTVDRYAPADSFYPRDEQGRKLDKASPLFAFPQAIETAVLLEAEPVTYIDQVPSKVSETQLRNPFVRLSEQQREAIAAEQKVPHTLDLNMVSFFTKLGEQGVMMLFGGGGDTAKRVLNKNHKASLDGQNMTAQSAYRTMQRLIIEMESVAEVKGLELNEVPVHYDYNFTAVNRMQMLGKDNPQANKLMREAILPTWKTIDLTDPAQLERFNMGLAQAMGVKVHNMNREQSLKELQKELAKFPSTLEIIGNHIAGLDINPTQIETMFNETQGKLTPAMAHAMMEYVRFQSADDKAQFRTATYFEADGVANGVSNAMMLFPSGAFSIDWLRNIRKGGYFPGQPNRSMNLHRVEDKVDLYEAAANATKVAANQLLTKYLRVAPVRKQIRSVNNLMDLFLGGVSVENDTLMITRNATKNPLTITLYGSGAAGIAGNIRDEIVGNIYAAMSEAAQRLQDNPDLTEAQALFGPDSATAEAQMDQFLDSINALTDGYLYDNKGAIQYKKDPQNNKSRGNFTEFSFSRKDLKNMQDNILHAFVGPMREGIEETVGEDLIHSTQILQRQIQAWSLYGIYAYRRAYTAIKKAGDYAASDLLSPADERKVLKQVDKFLPFISTGTQNFLMGGTQSVDLGQEFEFGRSLTGSLRTNAFLYGPGQAGVSGIPFMTIGAGDGQMMQYLSTNEATPFGRLTIFDGVHSSAEELDQMGNIANQSAFQAWENNPLGSVTEAFAGFVNGLEAMDLTEDELKALTRTLFQKEQWDVPFTEAQIIDAMQYLSEQGVEAGKIAAARHEVIKKVGASIDQMAGAGAPYQHEGTVDLTGMADSELVNAFNILLQRELTPKEEPKEEEEAQPAPSSIPALLKLVDDLKADRQTKALLRDTIRSMAVEGWTVVDVPKSGVISLLVGKGLSAHEAQQRMNVSGFTIQNEKTIYVVDGNAETVLHELLHAATFDRVLSHYEGRTVSLDVSAAVVRLEGLMEQFKKLDISNTAYLDTLDEMEFRAGRLQDSEAIRKAAELNEFMAWSLSNADLSNQLKTVKVENKALRLARAVIKEIKALLWGGKRSAAVKDDLFTNIRFNSSIIMRSQPSKVALVGSQMLFHNPRYGQDDSLSDLNRQIQSRIGDYVREDFTSKDKAFADRKVLLTRAARIANRMSAGGFPMNAQQQFTFINLVAILGTDVDLNPNAATRLQELYRHVVKNLSVESFMENPESDDPNDRFWATEQFNSVVGKFLASGDTRGRSFLLPSFLALAMVHDDFRRVLIKIDMPKGEYGPWNSVDNILDNLGNGMMANVSRLMSGEGNAKNISDALDALTDSLLETAEDRELYIEKFTNPIGDASDRLNEIVQGGMDSLSQTVMERSRQVKADSNSYVKKGLANAAEMVAAVINESAAQQHSEHAMSVANRTGMWKALHDLLNDLVGRTESNASIYDLIKVARAWGQQIRQQFREKLPQILASHFSRELTDAEWSAMHRGLAQTDIASLRSGYTMSDIMGFLGSESLREQAIEALEIKLGELQPKHGVRMRDKAIQLAKYMIRKETGTNLLRNAEAIAHLLGENVVEDPSAETVTVIDHLTSLLALQNIPETERQMLASLVQTERQGVTFITSYLEGQRKDELIKSTGNARFNHYKGYVPSENASKGSLVIVDNDKETIARMIERSYVVLGSYHGSLKENATGRIKKVYMYAPVSGRAPYAQGIMQNVQLTSNGVHQDTGFSMELNAGQITAPELVERIRRNQGDDGSNEALVPLYNKDGRLYAYERSIDPNMLQTLERDTHLGKMIGVWAGRQIEEAKSFELNKVLIDRLRDMYDADKKAGRLAEYVNVFKSGDPVLQDAASIISDQARAYIAQRFPKGFMVRKDMLNDALGYRSASVGDVWTGNSRWSEATQENVKKMLLGVFGRKAYSYMVNAEKTLQNFITDARVTIVIRSMVVPMANMAANVLQLIGRGVPAVNIFKAVPQKTAEIDSYVKSRHRQMEAEAELRANVDPFRERKLRSEIQSITDAHKRMSIWPLIEAGEFSAISDAGSREDVLLGEGRLSDYIEGLVNKLPDGVRTAGKYAMISRDTALFKGLQKSIEYGDFIAKAVLYDELTKRKGLNQKAALARITEEFVNYDRLPGRFRGYMESVGLLWFWNFKIRSAKVAMSMIRNNPVHVSLAMLMPLPSVVGSIGLPIDDNFWMTLFDGRLENSIGFGQALRAPGLLPINNLW